PSIYLETWVPAYSGGNATAADNAANNATLTYLNNLAPQLGSNSQLAMAYYQAFYGSWRGLSSTFNSTYTPQVRAGLSVNQAVPVITAPPTPAFAAGILNAVWGGLSFATWNQTTPLFLVVQTVLSTGSPFPPLPISLLESIYMLGPSPGPMAVRNLAN